MLYFIYISVRLAVLRAFKHSIVMYFIVLYALFPKEFFALCTSLCDEHDEAEDIISELLPMVSLHPMMLSTRDPEMTSARYWTLHSNDLRHLVTSTLYGVVNHLSPVTCYDVHDTLGTILYRQVNALYDGLYDVDINDVYCIVAREAVGAKAYRPLMTVPNKPKIEPRGDDNEQLGLDDVGQSLVNYINAQNDGLQKLARDSSSVLACNTKCDQTETPSTYEGLLCLKHEILCERLWRRQLLVQVDQ